MISNCKQTVSIIIPVSNVEGYLDDCILSVTKQSYQNIEIIIIIDDESTDSSSQICDRWSKKDNRIRVVHEKHTGLGLARDTGIEISKGDWICFVDGDDIVHPRYVELLLKSAIEKNALTCHARHLKFRVRAEIEYDEIEEDLEISTYDIEEYFIYMFKRIDEGHSPFAVWTNIYHKSLFENIRFGAMSFAEDSAFTPKIINEAKQRPLCVIEARLYFYRQREGSLLHARADLSRLDRVKAKQQTLNLWKEIKSDVLFGLFWSDYLFCLREDYFELCRDLPGEYYQYAFIKNKLLEDIFNNPLIEKYCPNVLTVDEKSGGKAWEFIDGLRNRKLIFYGDGKVYERNKAWLEYYGFIPYEIWDKKYLSKFEKNGQIFSNPYDTLENDAYIMILISSCEICCEVEMQLRKKGYRNFVYWRVIAEALKYKKNYDFLPELL